jgi:hypothetical protein
VVCAICGAPIAESRSGKWLHTEAPPGGMPEHDADPADGAVYRDEQEQRQDLRVALDNLLRHHNTLHPDTCEFARQSLAALTGRLA